MFEPTDFMSHSSAQLVNSHAQAGFTFVGVLIPLILLGMALAIVFGSRGQVLDVRSRLKPYLDKSEETALAASWFRQTAKTLIILSTIYSGLLLMSFDSFAASCAPPRHYQYTLSKPVALPCRGPNLDTRIAVMKVIVPDRGHAIARANFTYSNTDPSVYYFWNGIVVVGGKTVGLPHGTDICPGATSSGVAILGYGDLDSNNQSTVSVMVQEGAAGCVDGAVIAASGTLDVWVEDPNPKCVGRDIRFISSTDVYGENSVFFWTSSMTQLLNLPVPAPAYSDRSEILIMGAVEGTPISGSTPYSCASGESNFNLAAQLTSADQGVLSTLKSAIPPFSGMGHLVLSLFAQAPYRPQTRSVSMWVRSDIEPPVTTDGCGSSVPCGDAKLGFVKMGAKSPMGHQAGNSHTPCGGAYNTCRNNAGTTDIWSASPESSVPPAVSGVIAPK